MKPLGERMRMAQKTREERAATVIAERLLENGASSSLARISPDQQTLTELRGIFEHI